jgi:hypothetical protein
MARHPTTIRRDANAADQRRPTAPTAAISSAAPTGFATCVKKPLRSARVRSSGRANAVSAMAGIRPPDVAHQDVGTVILDERQRVHRRRRREDACTALRQHVIHELARVAIVVDDQHGDAPEIVLAAVGADRRRRRCALGSGPPNRGERQRDRERRAPPLAGALTPERATVQLDELPSDRQAEPEAAEAPARRGIG